MANIENRTDEITVVIDRLGNYLDEVIEHSTFTKREDSKTITRLCLTLLEGFLIDVHCIAKSQAYLSGGSITAPFKKQEGKPYADQ